jgi:hypothetical protein
LPYKDNQPTRAVGLNVNAKRGGIIQPSEKTSGVWIVKLAQVRPQSWRAPGLTDTSTPSRLLIVSETGNSMIVFSEETHKTAVLKLNLRSPTPANPDLVAFEDRGVDTQINPAVEVSTLIGDVAFQQADAKQPGRRELQQPEQGWRDSKRSEQKEKQFGAHDNLPGETA